MTENILITGSPGWLGNTLIRKLGTEEVKIRCLVHPSFKNVNLKPILPNYKNLEICFGDVTDQDKVNQAMKNISVVYHCAGVQHPKSTDELYEVNRDGTRNLIIAASQEGVEKFIYVSSSSVHGTNVEKKPYDENTPVSPITHYAHSKVEAESVIRDEIEKTGIDTVIIRPGVFYGQNPVKTILKLFDMIKKNRVFVFAKGDNLRSYVDIEKVAYALILARKKGKMGEIYLIGDEKPITTKEFLRSISVALSKDLSPISLPIITSRFAEKTAYILGKTINYHFALGTIVGEFSRDNFFTPKKAKNRLGYVPRKDTSNGLKEMVYSVTKK